MSGLPDDFLRQVEQLGRERARQSSEKLAKLNAEPARPPTPLLEAITIAKKVGPIAAAQSIMPTHRLRVIEIRHREKGIFRGVKSIEEVVFDQDGWIIADVPAGSWSQGEVGNYRTSGFGGINQGVLLCGTGALIAYARSYEGSGPNYVQGSGNIVAAEHLVLESGEVPSFYDRTVLTPETVEGGLAAFLVDNGLDIS